MARDAQISALSEPAATTLAEDEERIRSVYAGRHAQNKGCLYSWWKPDVLMNLYRFQVEAAAILRKVGCEDLSNLRVLDVGCGSGNWLRQLRAWGARAANLHGIDLLPDRIALARALALEIDYRVGSGWQIPFEDGSMDLVTAHTVFSSILDSRARQRLAGELTRVLGAHGQVLVFDFRISRPSNHDTIGIRQREIRRLFPGFQLHTRSLDLAPPIARRIAPVSPLLAMIMEASCPFLRTHAFHLLQRS